MSGNPFDRSATATASRMGGGVESVKSSDPYAASTPSGVSEHSMANFVGELMLVEPVEYIESMTTSASKEPTDAFRINMVPLTGELAGELLEDLMVFQIALKRELKKTFSGANRWLLARLERGTAKPGQSAPYLFIPPDAEDTALYEKFKASKR